MKRGLASPIAFAVLLILGGCGSSSGSGGGSTASTATAPSASTPASKSALKVNTKPKYGTPSSSAPVQSGTVQIAYRNIAINPDTVRVRVGSTIRWTNYDTVEHNVTSEGGTQRFASKNFGEGASFEVRASRPGVIHYLCTIHPASMNGTIEVVR
ncbi:MAG TPA: plastocyanin/azurin family copper-binding protein [Solirubrobacteraceae bacterium]|jgi:plastocyanin